MAFLFEKFEWCNLNETCDKRLYYSLKNVIYFTLFNILREIRTKYGLDV